MAFKVTTKKDKASPEVETSLEINFAGCSEAQLKAMATCFIVIKWQGQARKKGIPATATINAVDYVPGKRAPAETLAEQLARLTPEERRKLIEQYKE